MVNRITILGFCAAALGAAALPQAAAAADYYDGGARPSLSYGQDEAYEGRVWHREDLRPLRPRRGYGPGPVVFDERDPGPAFRHDRPAYRDGGPAYGEPGPLVVERPAYGYAPPPGAPRFARPFGPPAYGVGPYRAASAYRDVEDPGFDERAGAPDVGCTVEEARSTTPAGWRKVVTHRTCYRR